MFIPSVSYEAAVRGRNNLAGHAKRCSHRCYVMLSPVSIAGANDAVSLPFTIPNKSPCEKFGHDIFHKTAKYKITGGLSHVSFSIF